MPTTYWVTKLRKNTKNILSKVLLDSFGSYLFLIWMDGWWRLCMIITETFLLFFFLLFFLFFFLFFFLLFFLFFVILSSGSLSTTLILIFRGLGISSLFAGPLTEPLGQLGLGALQPFIVFLLPQSL